MRHGYWARHSTDDAIEKALLTYKIRHTKLSDPQKPPRNFSARAKFSVVQGRMEFGPRALGSRSIIAES